MGIPFLGRWLGHSEKPAWNLHEPPIAAESETAEAQFELGRQSAEGAGTLQTYSEALKHYLKAAEQGHGAAQFNLGLLYEQGKGVPRNETTALMWLRKAADRGHAGAQYHVGVKLHRASKSVRQPEASECRTEAFKWLQLAFSQGYRGADAAREFVALGMTWAEVAEGGRRAVGFAAAQVKPGADAA